MVELPTRSPLKAAPLRQAGQSVEKEIDNVVWDEVLPYVMSAVLLSSIALVEWWSWYAEAPPQPVFSTVVAGIAVVVCLWKLRRARSKLRQLRQARDGERVVGEFLERLRESGFKVFHDILGPRFNIDHVVIGPKGVFTIETKTWSKPARGQPRITFDGESLKVAGLEPDRDPIVQGRAQARWLGQLLAESSGRKVPVRPVIVFPGWFIEGPLREKKSEVWVLEPKALPGFLDHEPEALAPEDVNLLAFHLSRYVRADAELVRS